MSWRGMMAKETGMRFFFLSFLRGGVDVGSWTVQSVMKDVRKRCCS